MYIANYIDVNHRVVAVSENCYKGEKYNYTQLYNEVWYVLYQHTCAIQLTMG